MRKHLIVRTTSIVVFAIGFASFVASPLCGATITGAGNVVDNDVPPLGSDGYRFFSTYPAASPGGEGSAGTDVGTLPSYISSLGILGTHYFSPGYSDITIGGAATASGIIYQAPGNGNSADLLTITLAGSGLPVNGFQLGLLGDNADAGGRGVSLTVTSGNAVTQTQTSLLTNRFYLFNVTNLVANEVITISGVSGVNSVTLGGVTFNPVPEPTTAMLLAIGLVSVAVRHRRQRVA